MSSKRDVLAQLSREELVAVVERFELQVADRRSRCKKDDLLEAVAASKKATLADILPELGRDRLKALCAALGLDDGGREKTVLVDRLIGRLLGNGRAAAAPKPQPAARRNGNGKASAAEALDLAPREKLTRE